MTLYPTTILSDAPIAYYRLGETSGTTLGDSSGNGLNGSYGTGHTLGSPGAIASDPNASVAFPANASAAVTVPPSALLNVPNLSVEAWVNFSSTSATAVLEKTIGNAVNTQYNLYAGGGGGAGNISFNLFPGNISAIAPITSNAWHHVVGTYDGANIKLYIDGVLAATTPTSVVIASGSGDLYLALLGGGLFPMAGNLNEIAIYGSALPQSRVTAHYLAGLSLFGLYPLTVFQDTPAAYYRLGDSFPLARDSSGNGYDGTYTGGCTQGQAGAIASSNNADVLLDGSTGYVAIAASLGLTVALSIEFWINMPDPDSAVISYPVSFGDAGAFVMPSVSVGGGFLGGGLGLFDSAATLSKTDAGAYTTAADGGKWTHIIVTYEASPASGTRAKFYKNGVSIPTIVDNITGNAETSTQINIGRRDDGDWYIAGMIDEVAIYNYALSPARIAAHYNAGIAAGAARNIIAPPHEVPMSYYPGDTLYASFTTQSIAGATADADSTPTAVLRRNGTLDTAVAVSIARNATGDYTASAALPLTYSGGDDVELLVSATVGGVSAKSILPLGKLDRTAQSVAQVVHRSAKVHFVSAGGNSSYDGFSPQTAKALPTQPSPGPGEAILVLSGTFAMDTTPLDLSGDGTTGVHLIGAGMGATVLTSNVLLADAHAIVKPGNGSNVADLTIQGIAATIGSTNQYQVPLGAAMGQSPFVGAVAERVQLLGDSDGFYINTPSQRTTLLARHCLVQTKYDAANLMASDDSRLELHDCDLIVAGPSTCNSGNTARALVSRGGSVSMHGGTLSAAGASSITRAAQTTDAGVINLYHVEMSSASATGTVYDLDNSGTSLSAYDCAYSATKTTGVITVQNIPATIGPSQDFNNTGQTTPVSSAAAFSGPYSVTLVFHDAGGNPVPAVVFNVVGVGSAIADGTGSRTVSLPGGTFTIRAVPISGTLWADTPITVSATATFNLVGTAITIPPPSDPSQTTAYLTTRDGQGNPVPFTTLTFQLIDPDVTTDSYNQAIFIATSNSSALLQIPLLQSTKYQARVGGGAWVMFTTGTAGAFALPEILGPQ